MAQRPPKKPPNRRGRAKTPEAPRRRRVDVDASRGAAGNAAGGTSGKSSGKRADKSGAVLPAAGGPSGRDKDLAVRVKTARGRKMSSTLWLQRQLNDPYVRRARAEGYRSRAAYKLLELDERFALLSGAKVVVDLGAAPGGWCQVAVQRGAKTVVGIDLLEMDPMDGVTLIQGDFTDEASVEAVRAAVGGPANIVLSDMAPNTSGHRETDHLRTVALVEAAAEFAQSALKPGGAFVAKTFQGGAGAQLVAQLKTRFTKVRHAKPPASRAGSPETYLIAQGFRG